MRLSFVSSITARTAIRSDCPVRVLVALACMLAMAAGPVRAQAPQIELVTNIPHSAAINAMAFSPDGSLVVSGGVDRLLKLWDAKTGQLLRTFEGSPGSIVSVGFSAGRSHLLSWSDDNKVRVWDAVSGQIVQTLDAVPGRMSLGTLSGFSPDGRWAYLEINNGDAKPIAALWNLETKASLQLRGHVDLVTAVAFSPDGSTVLTADKTLRLWDLSTGRPLGAFGEGPEFVTCVAFSKDGAQLLAGRNRGGWERWDVGARKLLESNPGVERVTSVGFLPANNRVAAATIDGNVKVSDAANPFLYAFGPTKKDPRGYGYTYSHFGVFSPDGGAIIADNGDFELELWDLETGKLKLPFKRVAGAVAAAAHSPDGKRVLTGGTDSKLRLWDTSTGRLLREFEDHTGPITSVGYEPHGRFFFSASRDGTVKLRDGETFAPVRQFEGTRAVLSPNGSTILISGQGQGDRAIELRETAYGKLLQSFAGFPGGVTSLSFSPEGTRALVGGIEQRDSVLTGFTVGPFPIPSLRLIDTSTGQQLKTFEIELDSGTIGSAALSPGGRFVLSAHSCDTLARQMLIDFGPALRPSDRNACDTVRLWSVAEGKTVKEFNIQADTISFTRDGSRVLSAGQDHTIKLWDAQSGEVQKTFAGHLGAVNAAEFSAHEKSIVSGSADGTARIWNAKHPGAKEPELAAMLATASSEWLTISHPGFFAASGPGAGKLIHLVRGLEVTTIGQVYQSLYNPDLVRMTLSGDADDEAEVEQAAKVINLEAVLDSGPAPEVAMLSPAEGTNAASDIVTVTARIADKGKGVGRIEWRVNGITATVLPSPSGPGPDYTLSRELALDAGANTIEVIAYNGCVEQGCNLLASLPASATIEYTASAGKVQGKLHVLAIGINDYVDKGYAPPGFGRQTFGKLTLAVADAKAFAAEMQKAGAEMYSEVRVWPAHDADATAAGLDAIIKKLSAEIQPRDTFVLFAAAHGFSDERGRFYLIPQDYQGGPDSLARNAISQERLQEWMSNIKARRAVILLDTCNSGEAVSGYARSRIGAGASEAAVGRLHEATGRPVLTASNASATETGKLGHGIFTYALMEALHRAATDSNGYIQVSGLAGYVEDLVPKLAAGLKEKDRAAIVIRGSGTGPQAAHFGTTGGDFALVKRLQ